MTPLQTTQQQKPKQNWLFNVIKFLFAFCILFGHTLPMVGAGYTQPSSYVFVEGFLFISGIFLYKTATTKKTNTFKYMGHKYLSLLPAIVFGAVVAFIVICVNLSGNWSWSEFGVRVGKFFADLIPIQLVFYNNQDFWFLVVLLWACFLFYPLVKKFPKVMTWVCLAVFLGCYLYNIIAIGSAEPWGIMKENDWFMDLWLFLRGFAGVSCGVFIAGLSNLCKINVKSKKLQAVFSAIVGCLFAGAVVIAFATYHTGYDFLAILLIQVLCFMVWNKMSYFNANYDFKFPTHLAGASLYIYVCHHRLNEATRLIISPKFIPWGPVRLILVVLIAIGVGFAAYFAVYYSKKSLKNRKPRPAKVQKVHKHLGLNKGGIIAVCTIPVVAALLGCILSALIK